jgi:hypothetical protein
MDCEESNSTRFQAEIHLPLPRFRDFPVTSRGIQLAISIPLPLSDVELNPLGKDLNRIKIFIRVAETSAKNRGGRNFTVAGPDFLAVLLDVHVHGCVLCRRVHMQPIVHTTASTDKWIGGDNTRVDSGRRAVASDHDRRLRFWNCTHDKN